MLVWAGMEEDEAFQRKNNWSRAGDRRAGTLWDIHIGPFGWEAGAEPPWISLRVLSSDWGILVINNHLFLCCGEAVCVKKPRYEAFWWHRDILRVLQTARKEST